MKFVAYPIARSGRYEPMARIVYVRHTGRVLTLRSDGSVTDGYYVFPHASSVTAVIGSGDGTAEQWHPVIILERSTALRAALSARQLRAPDNVRQPQERWHKSVLRFFGVGASQPWQPHLWTVSALLRVLDEDAGKTLSTAVRSLAHAREAMTQAKALAAIYRLGIDYQSIKGGPPIIRASLDRAYAWLYDAFTFGAWPDRLARYHHDTANLIDVADAVAALLDPTPATIASGQLIDATVTRFLPKNGSNYAEMDVRNEPRRYATNEYATYEVIRADNRRYVGNFSIRRVWMANDAVRVYGLVQGNGWQLIDPGTELYLVESPFMMRPPKTSPKELTQPLPWSLSPRGIIEISARKES